jgi:hypothetical protein
MSWQIFLLLMIILVNVIVLIRYLLVSAAQREAVLLEQLAACRKDNKILTEAITRNAGVPVVFEKPETKPAVTWFDSKPKLSIKKD